MGAMRLRGLVLILGAVALFAPGWVVSTWSAAQALSRGEDFATVWAATRAFWGGADPYRHADLDRVWAEGEGDADARPVRDTTPSVYPPTAFVALTPLAAADWPVARALWAGANVLFVLAAVAMAARLAGVRLASRHGAAVALTLLATLPWGTGIMMGQTAAVVVCLGCAATLLLGRGRSVPAGVLLGLAVAIKPQLAGAFVLYALWTRQWRAAATAAVVASAFAGGAVWHLRGQPDWRANWVSNLKLAATPGGVNDAGPANEIRYQLAHLHVLARSVIDRPPIAQAIAWGAAGVLGVAFLAAGVRRRRRGAQADRLLELSCLIAVTFLPVYHRAYDLWLLAPCVAWCVREWLSGGPRRALAAAALAAVVAVLYAGPLAYHVSQSPLVADASPRFAAAAKVILENARSAGVLLCAVGLVAGLFMAGSRQESPCPMPGGKSVGAA
jgi:hypothetical protein